MDATSDDVFKAVPESYATAFVNKLAAPDSRRIWLELNGIRFGEREK
jgi:hypothetical protein